MEVRYRREMSHNFMIIEASAQELGYECRMLAGNNIEGLLKFRVRYGEEKREFYYDITSLQPIRRVLEKRRATGEEIRRILLAVIAAVRRIQEFLLPEEQLLLDPDYVYVEPDSLEVKLCLLPGSSSDWPKELSAFLQFLLEKADPQDKDAVTLAYNLYRESVKENCGAEDLLKFLAVSGENVPDTGQEDDRQLWEMRGIGQTVPQMREELQSREELQARKKQQSREEPEATKKLHSREKLQDSRREGERTWEDASGKRPEQEENGEKERRKNRMAFFLKGGVLLLGLEAVLWYVAGPVGMSDYGLFLAAGVLGLGGLSLVVGRNSSKTFREQDSAQPEAPSWELQTESESEYRDRLQQREAREMQKSREEGTVLLTEVGGDGRIGRLEPLRREEDAIEVSYVPFVIGKHPQLSDYCLDRPTISRLHARIDRKEDVCILTDLKSTNGTAVTG